MSTATRLLINRMALAIDRAFAFDISVGGSVSNTQMGFAGPNADLN